MSCNEKNTLEIMALTERGGRALAPAQPESVSTALSPGAIGPSEIDGARFYLGRDVTRRSRSRIIAFPARPVRTMPSREPDQTLRAKRNTQRIRIDRVSGANHDLIRLLNKPGHDGMRTIL